jgi:hypothetical protein
MRRPFFALDENFSVDRYSRLGITNGGFQLWLDADYLLHAIVAEIRVLWGECPCGSMRET